MTGHQKKQFDEIVRRWRKESYPTHTAQQACLDIGVLCGIIADLNPDAFKEGGMCSREYCAVHGQHYHRDTPDGEEVVFENPRA